MKKLLFFVLAAGMLSSCTVTYKSRTARQVSAPAEFTAQPYVADLVVSETKVSGNTEGFAAGGTSKLIRIPGVKKQMENYAVAAALQNANADVLVDPQFTYEYRKSRLASVSVTGYPAVHKNFRTIPYEEVIRVRAKANDK